MAGFTRSGAYVHLMRVYKLLEAFQFGKRMIPVWEKQNDC